MTRAPFTFTSEWFRGRARRDAEAQLAAMPGAVEELRLLADVDLYDVVLAARAPLDLEGVEPFVAAALLPRVRPHLRGIAVTNAVLMEISEHARTAKPGYEICGRIVLSADGRARRYDPLINHAKEPGKALPRSSWRPGPGEQGIGMHSHPRAAATPSDADLDFARRYDDVFAVFHVPTRQLHVYRATGGRDYEELPVAVVHPMAGAPTPRRYSVNLAEGFVFDPVGQLVAGGYSMVMRRLRGASA